MYLGITQVKIYTMKTFRHWKKIEEDFRREDCLCSVISRNNIAKMAQPITSNPQIQHKYNAMLPTNWKKCKCISKYERPRIFKQFETLNKWIETYWRCHQPPLVILLKLCFRGRAITQPSPGIEHRDQWNRTEDGGTCPCTLCHPIFDKGIIKL